LNIFKYLDYIDALDGIVKSRKKGNKKFTYLSLAEAIKVHRPYLSRVLKKQADLSEDQWYLTLEFLELTEEEKHYLTLIHQYTRSFESKRKSILLKKIKKIQKDKRNSSEQLKAKMQNPEASFSLNDYYLDPKLVIVHFYFTIVEVQKNPELICERWGLGKTELEIAIKKLIDFGFIEYNGVKQKYDILVDHIHLSPDSPLTKAHQSMMRMRSFEQISSLGGKSCYNFAITLSTDDSSRAEIQKEFMDFLKKAEQIVVNSKAKKVYQMNFDLFPWERDS
jgi:uncharacterized protein (TIGR02147 family)